jgi:hypothetical protein
MKSPAVILRTALVTQAAFCLPTATPSSKCPVFVGHLPDMPDIAACIYDTPGYNEGRLMETGFRVYKPGIQVRVRGKAYEATYAILDAVRAYFESILWDSVVVGTESYRIDAIRTTSYFAWGTKPDETRLNFSLNCVATITKL